MSFKPALKAVKAVWMGVILAAAGWVSLVLAVGVWMTGWAAFAPEARGDNGYLLYRAYDRPVYAPYDQYQAGDTAGVSGNRPFNPYYAKQVVLWLDLEMVHHPIIPHLLVAHDLKIRKSTTSPDNLLSIDMGAGLRWTAGAYNLSVFGSSEHYFGGENKGWAYNFVELRYHLPWGGPTDGGKDSAPDKEAVPPRPDREPDGRAGEPRPPFRPGPLVSLP
ncbi:MAG: hypothetical protein OEW12_09605 [Deltaproteobacteria bacterium]|nr:hypothetical protein [Deltaproteobacteria bacterium]